MRELIFVLILFITQVNNVFGNDFYDNVLSDFRIHSFFVAVNVEVKNQEYKFIIENTDLYRYLSKEKGFDKDEYKKFIREILIKNENLSVREDQLDKWHFIKVEKADSLNTFACKGKEEFLNNYFQKRVIKDGLESNVRTAIINKLFEWQIAAHIDDETGYLVYTQFDK